MITPEKMESYNQNKVVEMYEKLNQDITKEIIAKIKEVGYVSGYTMSQMKSIIKTGGKEIFQSVLLKTNELSAGRKKEVLKVYNDIAEEMLKDYQAQYERVGADYGVSPDMIDLINYMAKATNETFKNMTKSVAFASKQEFTNAMDSLYKQVVSGQKDYASAMKQIISSLAEKGITLSSKGRNYSLESMVRLNLMTGLTQTTNDIAKKIGDIIDYNCVEIGHSYKCRPSHHPIDDVVMSKEEFKKYEYLTEEYNCYHIVNYDWREEFEDKDHKVEYGEEHQTLEETKRNYDVQQKARYYERQIRAKKQAIANGDTSIEARRELRNAQSKYKVYCNNNGLKIDHLRTWKAGYNNANLKVSNSSNKTATKKINLTPLKKDDIFKYKGEEYIYDGKHVKYDLNQKEIEFANWLSKYYIKSTITLNPTINVPEGISTADLTIDDKLYDMKIITGSSKQVLYHNMYGKENQASRFIFETSSSKLTLEELESQVENIFERKDMKFVEEICIKKGNKYKIYTRK